MGYVAITNNPQVAERYGAQIEVRCYPEEAPRELLLRARDKIHLGWRLVSHPLAGSVKPHQTPYRSLLLAEPEGEQGTDALGLLALEDSMAAMRKFGDFRRPGVRAEEILADLRLVDLDLFGSAMAALGR